MRTLALRMLPTVFTVLAVASPDARAGSMASDALNWAFRFASAIVSDPKDMGKAQAAIVWDYATLGAWRDATTAADRVEGWRRGTSYADLATALAKDGRKDEARTMIAKAERFREAVTGWQNPRIAAHVANAWAALGEVDKAEGLARAVALEDAQQYAGRTVATVASSRAARGDYKGAVAALDGLAAAKDIDDAWWRTVGYLDVARQTSFPRATRAKALAAARTAADSIPTWKKAEALESIADEYRNQLFAKEAREAVAEAERILVALPDTMPIKAPLLSNCARAWGELGKKERARELLNRVEALAPTVQPIERPAVYANAASSFALLGDAASAKRLYGIALDQAGSLVNSRPRALAVVEICRSMGRASVPLDNATRGRLDTLYSGLKDPW
jgi:tetratricopeptide (TPR) repeat protein